jgi:hypothetical protein
MNLKERARDAFRKAVTRTEIQSYESATLGWRKSETEVVLDVPGRPRHKYITKSDGTTTIALNEANVPLSAFLPVKVRLENNTYVIKGQNVSATNALTNLPSNPYGIPSHPLSSHMDVAFANVQPGQVLGTEDGEIRTNMDASGGVETFIELTDTPADYTGAANLYARVNAAGDALVFDNVAWADIGDIPPSFPPSAHTHAWADITDPPTEFPPSAHTHLWAEITDPPATYAPSAHTHLWAEIVDPPATYAPSTHSHPITDIVDIEITTPALNQVLAYNGTKWVNQNPAALSDTGIFLLLAGRAGGQVANGGTGAGDDLILESTSHATKGDVIIQPNGGNFGVGVLSPATKFHVRDAAASLQTIFETTGGSFANVLTRYNVGGTVVVCQITATSAAGIFGTATNHPLLIRTNNVEVARWQTDGRFGLGVTSPQGKLHIYDSGSGFLYATAGAVDGTLRTIIPDASGDVAALLLAEVIVTVFGPVTTTYETFTLTPGVSYTVNISTSSFTFTVTAGGGFTVQRTAGAQIGTITLRLMWQ